MIFFHIPFGGTGTLYFPLQGSATAALSTAASGSLNGTTINWNMDGSAWAATTNTATALGSGGYKLVLTAGETTGKIGLINIKSSNGIFEDQVLVYQTYGNPSAAIPFNFGTNEVILRASQATATIGTVLFLASGTVNTVLNSVTATITGTPAVNAVAFLGTPIVGTQGTLTNIGTAGTALGTVAATVAYLTSSRVELSGVPGSSVDIGTKIDFLYMISLNPLIQGSGATSTLTLRNNADGGLIGTRTVTDDGSTLKSAKWA